MCIHYTNRTVPVFLKNKFIEVTIDLPQDNYQFSRFDWSGKIVDFKYRGIPITTTEKPFQKDNDPFGKGFYNEFGIQDALGFHEAPIGGWFHKIGVGLLKKDSEQYDFQKSYKIKPALFKSSHTSTKMVSSCKAQLSNGYAYVLTKQIVLVADGFKISYQLHNTGSKVIETNEYCHNFLNLVDAAINNRYRLEFPFILEPSQFSEITNPKRLVAISGPNITIPKGLKNTVFMSNLSGSKSVNAKWLLQDSVKKISISEHGDFLTSQLNLWAEPHVMSPELFVAIHIEPNDTFCWERRFSVHQL